MELRERMTLFGIASRLRKPLLMAACLFAIGVLMGGVFSGTLTNLLTPMAKGLRQEAAQLVQDHSLVKVAFSIFSNNLRVSLFMMVGGVVFGVLPALGAFANGALIGYVLYALVVRTHANLFLVVLAGILPHGIFEIPAYLLASAVGMRYGALVWRGMLGRTLPGSWQRTGKDTAPAILWVMGLLVVAAAVETFVTPVLIGSVVGIHTSL